MSDSFMTITMRRDYILIFVLTLLSRIPFVFTGAGTDSDAWRVIAVAQNWSLLNYQSSRNPGTPILETLTALAWQLPIPIHITTNLFSVIASAFAATALWWLLRNVTHTSRSTSLWIVAAFVLSPAVFIASTSTADYIIALAFALGSVVAIYHKKPIIAALLLSLAIGTRLTYGVMVLPFAYLLWHQIDAYRVQRTITFMGIAVVVGLAFYIPPFMTTGGQLFEVSTLVSWVQSIFAIQLFGWVGTAAILSAILAASMARKPIRVSRQIKYVTLFVVVIYTIVFLRLPHEAAYLLPIVPWVFLILANWLDRAIVPIICILIIVSGIRMQYQNVQIRQYQMGISNQVATTEFEEPYILVAYELAPMLRITTDANLIYVLPQPPDDTNIYYLREALSWHVLYEDIDLASVGRCLNC
jgi:hypothetical protein